MLVTESSENTCIQRRWATVGRFHLEKELGSSSTRHMKCCIAVFIAALDTGTHFLLADVTTLNEVNSWDNT